MMEPTTHEIFINKSGRRWTWVCITCKQYNSRFGRRDSIDDCFNKHKENDSVIYDRTLTPIAKKYVERKLF